MRGHVAAKKNKSGTKYYIVVDVKDEVTGKRKRKWLTGKDGKGFERKKDAEKEMPDVLKRFYDGTIKAGPTDTFGELMSTWLKDKKGKVRHSTWKSYEWLINHHLLSSVLADMKADKLQPKHFRELYDKLGLKLAKASIKKLSVVIIQALDRAVTDGDVPRNVARGIDLPEGKGVETFEVWTEEEVNLFLNYAKVQGENFALYEMALNTGMRQSELFGIPRTELDLIQTRCAYIRQAFVLGEDGREIDDPKTKKSRRPVPLFESTVHYMSEHLKKQSADMEKNKKIYNDHGLVFQTSIGTPILPRNMMRNFYAIMNRIVKDQEKRKAKGEPYIEFKKIRFQDLRHTHATILLKRGVHPKIVQERLGHSSVQVTLDIYSHVVPNLQEAVLKEIGTSITGNKDLESKIPHVSVDYDEGLINTYRGIVINHDGQSTRINTGDFYRDFGYVQAEYAPFEQSNSVENFIRDTKKITLLNSPENR